MRIFQSVVASLFLLGFAAATAAQSDGVYVNHEKVNAALAKGGVLVSTPQVRVAGGHRDKPGALETQKATTILYVTDGEGVFAAGARTQRLTKGDLLVVPAGMPQAFTSVSPSISYYVVTVPTTIRSGSSRTPPGIPGLSRTPPSTPAKAEVVYVGHDQVAAAIKKPATLADGPNLRVSGGYRTGPYAPANYRPAVEVHTNEADLFYVIEGSAKQVLGGSVIGGKETGPGQIRGSTIEGGTPYRLGKGDVMWVPASVPHWFPEIPEPLSYLLVKLFY